ncbi:MAG: hypothetical protein DWQ19_08920 [Crenarchaeota archaeon]|nr:MAG: hypothetical protein DWQ19_08920 [Thermoproteota archaeon]
MFNALGLDFVDPVCSVGFTNPLELGIIGVKSVCAHLSETDERLQFGQQGTGQLVPCFIWRKNENQR